jgi:hypothetical protein
MSVIDDLKDSISSMSDGQLMDLILSVRANRRIRKDRPTKVKKKQSNIVDLTKLVSNISPEAAKALLAQLNKKKG